jgi:hypothetical protein
MTETQLAVPSQVVCDLISTCGVDGVAEALSYLIVRDRLEFPYKKYFIRDMASKFHNLTEYRCEILYDQEYTIPALQTRTSFLLPYHFRGRYTVLPGKASEYEDILSSTHA